MKIVSTILSILAVPVAAFEYFVLFWFWGGDGIFTLVATPICFAAWLVACLLILKKLRPKLCSSLLPLLVTILLLPIVTTATVWGAASLLGITIVLA